MENGEMEALASLNCLHVGRLNEIMAIFKQFIKCVDGNFVAYLTYRVSNSLVSINSFGIFPLASSVIMKIQANIRILLISILVSKLHSMR
jgi:hypothetical protein